MNRFSTAKINGKYRRTSRTIKTICRIDPLILPVTKKPLIIGGIVHEAAVRVNGTNPEDMAKYATTTLIIGAITNGTNNMTFNTIVTPNIVGSLILNIPGTTVIGANTFVC